MTKTRARCPQCHQPLPADAPARWRPFCSERCKMADLGQWFSERYAIPAEPDPDSPAAPDEPQTPRQ